ncbi:MAG: hypothetical protein KDB27_30695 [Planctomycetales bacterium]|nr:hypothetical protein [Planctomycetales bacterium]
MNSNMHRIRPFTVAAMFLILLPAGCRRSDRQAVKAEVTSTEVRSSRRAYDGSPPVIPHKPLGATCVTCHTTTGTLVPNMTYAPANPHGNEGRLQNCRQCHLFQHDEGVFVNSDFVAVSQSMSKGDRLFPGAPPTIPHSLSMRSNCAACHCTQAARPEIRCSHPERANCVQCHVPHQTTTEFSIATASE